MLPLSDRLLLALHARPATERDLSSKLGADGSAVRAVLRGLRDQGVVVTQVMSREASLWRLAPGVRLTYRPPAVLVQGAVALPPLPPLGSRCRVVVSRGHPCRVPTGDEVCFIHARQADTQTTESGAGDRSAPAWP